MLPFYIYAALILSAPVILVVRELVLYVQKGFKTNYSITELERLRTQYSNNVMSIPGVVQFGLRPTAQNPHFLIGIRNENVDIGKLLPKEMQKAPRRVEVVGNPTAGRASAN